MNKNEAIEILKNKLKKRKADTLTITEDTFEIKYQDYLEDDVKEAIEVLESEGSEKKLNVSEILGWEEGQVYKIQGSSYKLEQDVLMVKFSFSDAWSISCLNNDVDTLELLKEKAVKKEPKLKAWHTPDEYSFNELKKEHDHWYNFINSCDNYIYEDEYQGRICLKWTDNLKEIEDTHEIIEYRKEPPKFFAKIKGWEVLGNDICYFYQAGDKNIYLTSEKYAGRLTKTEWVELGITNEKVVFERVE